MDSVLVRLQDWYAARCNGDWEHQYGVKIDTLDNPGWHAHINLKETAKENAVLDWKKIERSEDGWVFYRAADKQFEFACGPKNVEEALAIFLDWFDTP